MSDSMRSDAFDDAREYGFTLGYARAQADRDKIGRTGKAAMSDLAARLRLCGNDSSSDFFETCADEIDRLRLALAQAEQRLEFADEAARLCEAVRIQDVKAVTEKLAQAEQDKHAQFAHNKELIEALRDSRLDGDMHDNLLAEIQGILDGSGSTGIIKGNLADTARDIMTKLAQAERERDEAKAQTAFDESQRNGLLVRAGEYARTTTLDQVEVLVEMLHRHGLWSNSGDAVAKAHSQGYLESAAYLRDKLRALRGATPTPSQEPT